MENLPADTINVILGFLSCTTDKKRLLFFSLVCKRFRKICENLLQNQAKCFKLKCLHINEEAISFYKGNWQLMYKQNEDLDNSGLTFVWIIPNFLHSTSLKLYSDYFEYQGVKWQLLLFPSGNENWKDSIGKALSMYLAWSKDSPKARADFSLWILRWKDSINSKTDSVTRATSHSFDSREVDWGFHCMLTLQRMQEENFLNNGCLRVGVKIQAVTYL